MSPPNEKPGLSLAALPSRHLPCSRFGGNRPRIQRPGGCEGMRVGRGGSGITTMARVAERVLGRFGNAQPMAGHSPVRVRLIAVLAVALLVAAWFFCEDE